MTARKRAAILLASAMTLIACGGGDSGAGDDTASANTIGATEQAESGGDGGSLEELEAAATGAFMAFVSGEDELFFEALSRECREHLGFAAVQGHLQGRRFNARELGGVDLAALDVSSVSADAAGSSGSVALEIEGTTEQFVESTPRPWVYEDGGWRMADCSDIGEAQGGIDDQGTDRSEPVGYGFLADIDGWLTVVTWIDANGDEFAIEGGAEPAADGNHLFVVGVTFTYNGAAESASLSDLRFAMVNGDTEYGDDASCHVASSDLFLDLDATAGPGETVGTGQMLCWEVPADAIDGMLLRVTHVPSGGEWWFDLTQP